MVKISYSAIYTINKIKLARMIQGKSARQLSKDATNNQDDYLISRHESEAYKTQYPHHTLISIAKVLNCDVRDLYPPDEFLLEYDGTRHLKEIINLSNLEDSILVINELIKSDFFVEGKTMEDTSRYLHEFGKPNALVIGKAVKALEQEKKLVLRDEKYYSA